MSRTMELERPRHFGNLDFSRKTLNTINLPGRIDEMLCPPRQFLGCFCFIIFVFCESLFGQRN
jgi:hypothetical protein